MWSALRETMEQRKRAPTPQPKDDRLWISEIDPALRPTLVKAARAALNKIENPEWEMIAQGSAQWHDDFMRPVCALNEAGVLYLGHAALPELKGPHKERVIAPLFWSAPRAHMLTVAGSRMGKGASSIIPKLLCYPGAALVVDPKGENAFITGKQRETLGEVFYLDPWRISGKPGHGFNPLDLLDPHGPDFIDDASMLAEALIYQTGDDEHWSESARGWVAGLIMHVCSRGEDERRTLSEVRRLLTLGPEDFKALIEEMQRSVAADGLVCQAADVLASTPERERGSIVSTARTQTRFLDSPALRESLAAGQARTFRPGALMEDEESVASAFLCIPPRYLGTHGRWLRLVISQTLRVCERSAARPYLPALFCLDEFPALGHMRIIEDAAGQMAGFGVCIWPIVQDIPQLKALYKERWETFIGNASVLEFFGLRDQTSCEYVSTMLGSRTIMQRTFNEGPPRNTPGFFGSDTTHDISKSYAPGSRRLMFPDEVRKETFDFKILITDQWKWRLEIVPYYEIPIFDGLYETPEAFTPTADNQPRTAPTRPIW